MSRIGIELQLFESVAAVLLGSGNTITTAPAQIAPTLLFLMRNWVVTVAKCHQSKKTQLDKDPQGGIHSFSQTMDI